MWYLYNLAYIYVVLMYILIYCLKSEKPKLWVYAEISDLHVGRQSPVTLEEAGELQTGAAQRHTTERRDRPGAEGRGEQRELVLRENWD